MKRVNENGMVKVCMSPKYGSRQKVDKMPYSHELYLYVQGLMEYVMHRYFHQTNDDNNVPTDEETKLDAINRLAS